MYQKCPVCNGTGIGNGKVGYCTTCNGSKIINTITGLPPDKYIKTITSTTTTSNFSIGNFRDDVETQQQYYGK